MTLPFDIIIKPTSEQMKKIPHYDHIKDIKEVAKRMMFNNYADKNRKVSCCIAQDEEFIYISKNKHFQYLSKCIKSDNVKYCMKFFGDTFEALSNEEIETRNKTYIIVKIDSPGVTPSRGQFSILTSTPFRTTSALSRRILHVPTLFDMTP